MRKPDWQKGDVRLWCGDCRDVIPAEPVALVTDPPYGIGERMQGGTWGAAAKYADFRRWDVAPEEQLLSQLIGGHPAIVWGGNYFALPPSRCWLAWRKINAVPTMASVELAWTNFDRPAQAIDLPVGKHSFGHPTEKPLRLMWWCLSFLGEETVFDPYMGSGTTCMVATSLSCRSIGIDLSAEYLELAKERNAQQALF